MMNLKILRNNVISYYENMTKLMGEKTSDIRKYIKDDILITLIGLDEKMFKFLPLVNPLSYPYPIVNKYEEMVLALCSGEIKNTKIHCGYGDFIKLEERILAYNLKSKNVRMSIKEYEKALNIFNKTSFANYVVRNANIDTYKKVLSFENFMDEKARLLNTINQSIKMLENLINYNKKKENYGITQDIKFLDKTMSELYNEAFIMIKIKNVIRLNTKVEVK